MPVCLAVAVMMRHTMLDCSAPQAGPVTSLESRGLVTTPRPEAQQESLCLTYCRRCLWCRQLHAGGRGSGGRGAGSGAGGVRRGAGRAGGQARRPGSCGGSRRQAGGCRRARHRSSSQGPLRRRAEGGQTASGCSICLLSCMWTLYAFPPNAACFALQLICTCSPAAQLDLLISPRSTASTDKRLDTWHLSAVVKCCKPTRKRCSHVLQAMPRPAKPAARRPDAGDDDLAEALAESALLAERQYNSDGAGEWRASASLQDRISNDTC